MTRRGSLIYYLSAWILGCFLISIALWFKDLWGATRMSSGLREAFGILFFYFYGLVLGALPALIFAFLLRKVAAILKCKTPWHWAMFGAFLAPLVVTVLGYFGPRFGTVAGNGWRVVDWFASGPHIVIVAGRWLSIPVGAVTAFLLCRIERAFAPQLQAEANASGRA
jgi:hypothetical protein